MLLVAKGVFMDLKRITVYIPTRIYSFISYIRKNEGFHSDSSVIRYLLNISLKRLFGDEYASMDIE